MELFSKEDYEKLVEGPKGAWFDGRWSYYSPVIEIVKGLDFNNVLEIGPGGLTIVKNCDILVKPDDDYWGRPTTGGKTIKHDATESPWPFEDNEYDLVIALQVWEHLDNKQSRAFRELKRISRMAVLSFPYLWDRPRNDANYPEHHMIDKELIGDWTLNIVPEQILEIPRTAVKVSRGPRLVYFWNFR